MQETKIELIGEKKFVGKKHQRPMDDMAIFIMWKEFANRKAEVKHAVSLDMWPIHIYDGIFYRDVRFTDDQIETWATVEVTEFEEIPWGMESITVEAGLYAIFEHQGTLATFTDTLTNIYENWFPSSEYCLDNRPHLSIRDPDYNPYKNTSEIVLIPVRKKEA